jgi:hypothetical protein
VDAGIIGQHAGSSAATVVGGRWVEHEETGDVCESTPYRSANARHIFWVEHLESPVIAQAICGCEVMR